MKFSFCISEEHIEMEITDEDEKSKERKLGIKNKKSNEKENQQGQRVSCHECEETFTKKSNMKSHVA